MPSHHRVLRACEPCKTRKKRCDGTQPCATCVRYHYNCYFSRESRTRLKQALRHTPTPEKTVQQPGSPSPSTGPPLQRHSEGRVRELERSREAISREAISSAAFSRMLSERLRGHQEGELPQHTMQPASLVRPQASSNSNVTQTLTSALSLHDVQRLVASFFDSVHPVYTFIRPAVVQRTVAARFSCINGVAEHDAILFGVAALGSLFLGDVATPQEIPHISLARNAQACLDADTARTVTPALDLIAASVLKTLYLRSTAKPYVTWIASCTTMHAVAAMETDIMNLSGVEENQDSCFDPCQTLWIARLLNTWISNEYGRPPVKTRFDALIIPKMPPNSTLVAPDEQMMYLYNISESLCPERQSNPEEYEASIVKLAALDAQNSHDGVLLSRTIMALAFYRRLRSSETADLKGQTFARLVEIGLDGLQAAKRLARRQKPWWHLANVPFQLLCTMLVIDTTSSFAQIPTALQALEEVAHAMPSSTITEALDISRKLINLSRLEMTKQVRYLDQCFGSTCKHTSSPDRERFQCQDCETEPPPGGSPIAWQASGIESQGFLDNFDWSFLPDMDIPIFDLDV